MPLRVGGCLSLHWTIWRDKDTEPWVVELLKKGYRIPSSSPPLSWVPVPIPSYSPTSIKGKALPREVLSLVEKGAVELTPPSLGYYSRLFVVWKATGSWRSVIDLSLLNHFVVQMRFEMETNQSVLRVVQRGDWIVTIDLKDAYLQVPVHPDSRHFLRFVAEGQVCHFKALCFGLSTAPQVFTRAMAPVSVILHDLGVQILRYLDNWLVLASSRMEALWARDVVLNLCQQFGIMVNLAKSHLNPSLSATYLGMSIESPSLRAYPSQERVSTLRSQLAEFLSCRRQGVVAWRSLLGRLSSLCLLVPGGQLRMRSLQLELRRQWDFTDKSVVVPWTPEIESDLMWWFDTDHLLQIVSLEVQHPDLLFWFNASDQGWGANQQDQLVSRRWLIEEHSHSINLCKLRAVSLGLHHFRHSLRGLTVGVFTDNTTALSYVKKRGTYPAALNREAQFLLRWAKSLDLILVSQFIRGSQNVVADSLSCHQQVLISEWTLAKEVMDELVVKWPATVDLFATTLNYRLPVYFLLLSNLMAVGTDTFLQVWDGLQAGASFGGCRGGQLPPPPRLNLPPHPPSPKK